MLRDSDTLKGVAIIDGKFCAVQPVSKNGKNQPLLPLLQKREIRQKI